MTDADEDRPATTQATDYDLSEETQDFRFLSSIIGSSAIPKRGESELRPLRNNERAYSADIYILMLTTSEQRISSPMLPNPNPRLLPRLAMPCTLHFHKPVYISHATT